MTTTEIASGTYFGKPRPYTRMGKHFTTALRKYLDNQKELAGHLFWEVIQQHHPDQVNSLRLRHRAGMGIDRLLTSESYPLIRQPFLFGLAIGVLPNKGNGKIPARGGDFDNFVKAFLDAAQRGQVIPDDNMRWYRGPCWVQSALDSSIRPGVYVSDAWWVRWTFRVADDLWMPAPTR